MHAALTDIRFLYERLLAVWQDISTLLSGVKPCSYCGQPHFQKGKATVIVATGDTSQYHLDLAACHLAAAHELAERGL